MQEKLLLGCTAPSPLSIAIPPCKPQHLSVHSMESTNVVFSRTDKRAKAEWIFPKPLRYLEVGGKKNKKQNPTKQNQPQSIQMQLSQAYGQQIQSVPTPVPVADRHYSFPGSYSTGVSDFACYRSLTAGQCKQLNRLFLH